jgi:hypothetical protein
MPSTPLIGIWQLDAIYITFSDDRPVRYPLGKNPIGFLSYHANGHMQAILSRKKRSHFPKSLEKGHLADSDAKATAFDESMAYAGEYQLLDGTVVHRVKCSTNPSIIGTEMTRTLVFLNDHEIELSYTIPTQNKSICTYVIRWKK